VSADVFHLAPLLFVLVSGGLQVFVRNLNHDSMMHIVLLLLLLSNVRRLIDL